MEPNATPPEAPTNVPAETPAPEAAVTPTVSTPSTPTVSTPGAGVVGGESGPAAPVSVAGAVTTGGKPGRKKWPFAIAAAVAVVLLGGGYTFGIYLPNQPDAVYKSSLTNSGKAVDKLVDYENTQAAKNYKSFAFDGTVNVKASGASFDVKLSGKFDKSGNGTGDASADILGQKVGLGVRSIKASGAKSPDLYLQATGIKQYLDGYGMSNLDSLDGQWISVDHTTLDNFTQGFTSGLTSGASDTSKVNLTPAAPTPAQVLDLAKKVQEVNKKYLFTTATDTAVLTKQSFVGKETKNGRSVDHYKVGYNKDHLAAYAAAIKSAADSSSLNDWAKKQDNKNLSEVINMDALVSGIKQLDGKYTFDLYADTGTKLIQSIQFTDPSDKSSSFTLAQGYTGGDVYPFSLTVDGSGSSSEKQHVVLSIKIDTKANKVTFGITGSVGGADINASFNATPGNDSVNVTAPANSKPLTDVLNQLGLGDLSGSSSSLSGDSSVSNLFKL